MKKREFVFPVSWLLLDLGALLSGFQGTPLESSDRGFEIGKREVNGQNTIGKQRRGEFRYVAVE